MKWHKTSANRRWSKQLVGDTNGKIIHFFIVLNDNDDDDNVMMTKTMLIIIIIIYCYSHTIIMQSIVVYENQAHLIFELFQTAFSKLG